MRNLHKNIARRWLQPQGVAFRVRFSFSMMGEKAPHQLKENNMTEAASHGQRAIIPSYSQRASFRIVTIMRIEESKANGPMMSASRR